MKPKTVFKSLADFFRKVVKPETTNPAQGPRIPNPTSEQQLRQALLLIEAEEDSGSTEYRHWGLNE
jgi:hypothetical protein